VFQPRRPSEGASRASRGGPGRLWPPRDARDGGLPGGCPRDGGRSDSRHRHAREKAHLPQTVTKDVGTPRFRPSSSSSRAWKRGPGTRCVYLAPHRGVNSPSAVVTLDQHARKRGLPTLFLTGSHFRQGSVTLPRPSPAQLPPPLRTPGRLGHGHSLPGPWTRRPVPSPGASLRVPVPSGRQPAGPRPFRATACGAPSLPRAPASRGPIPSGHQLPGPRTLAPPPA
jgi:hypothetical protein